MRFAKNFLSKLPVLLPSAWALLFAGCAGTIGGKLSAAVKKVGSTCRVRPSLWDVAKNPTTGCAATSVAACKRQATCGATPGTAALTTGVMGSVLLPITWHVTNDDEVKVCSSLESTSGFPPVLFVAMTVHLTLRRLGQRASNGCENNLVSELAGNLLGLARSSQAFGRGCSHMELFKAYRKPIHRRWRVSPNWGFAAFDWFPLSLRDFEAES